MVAEEPAQVADALPVQVVVVATARLPAQVADALPAQAEAGELVTGRGNQGVGGLVGLVGWERGLVVEGFGW